MNWRPEFAQCTRPLSLSRRACPSFVLGPEGPIAMSAYWPPSPGVSAIYTPAERITRGERTGDLPARSDTAGPLETHTGGPGVSGEAAAFFRGIASYAPSSFNPDFLVAIGGDIPLLPVSSPHGVPGFSARVPEAAERSGRWGPHGLPWVFQVHLSI